MNRPWLRMQKCLPDHPKVVLISEQTNTHVAHVVGGLLIIWGSPTTTMAGFRTGRRRTSTEPPGSPAWGMPLFILDGSQTATPGFW